jgi:hypothetical protein
VIVEALSNECKMTTSAAAAAVAAAAGQQRGEAWEECLAMHGFRRFQGLISRQRKLIRQQQQRRQQQDMRVEKCCKNALWSTIRRIK